MEFDLRAWLLVLGSAFVVGILIHGYWKLRRGSGDLKMGLDKAFLNSKNESADSDDISHLRGELPNGGARVSRGSFPHATDDLNLEEDVPVLTALLDAGSVIRAETGSDAKIPDVEIPEQYRSEVAVPEKESSEAESPEAEGSEAKIPVSEKNRSANQTIQSEKPTKFVVVHLAADGHFDGQILLEAIVELDMVFGEMDIFHRLGRNGKAEFSLANSVEPGTFVLAEMDQLQITGVVLFMQAHELNDPVRVYDSMIEVAMKLGDEVGGKLLDESRSTMTSQTIEHCRQGLQDFQYKYSA